MDRLSHLSLETQLRMSVPQLQKMIEHRWLYCTADEEALQRHWQIPSNQQQRRLMQKVFSNESEHEHPSNFGGGGGDGDRDGEDRPQEFRFVGESLLNQSFERGHRFLSDLTERVESARVHFSVYMALRAEQQRAVYPRYRAACKRRIVVSLDQCVKTDMHWATNTRKVRFETEVMQTVKAETERAIGSDGGDETGEEAVRDEAVDDEVAKLYMYHMNIIFLYCTRNRNTVNLDKYNSECDRLFQKTGCLVQLFNLRDTMFNPLRHTYVPYQCQLDEWYDYLRIQRLMEGISFDDHSYDAKGTGPNLPVITPHDPVAKFIGTRRRNMYLTLRICQSGMYYMPRSIE